MVQGAAICGCLVQRAADYKFVFQKDYYYLDSGKIDVVKMIFHVLFLVLETIEMRKRTNYLHFP